MPKQTQIEKIIAKIDADIAVLLAARDRIVAEQRSQSKRRSKPVAVAPRDVAAS